MLRKFRWTRELLWGIFIETDIDLLIDCSFFKQSIIHLLSYVHPNRRTCVYFSSALSIFGSSLRLDKNRSDVMWYIFMCCDRVESQSETIFRRIRYTHSNFHTWHEGKWNRVKCFFTVLKSFENDFTFVDHKSDEWLLKKLILIMHKAFECRSYHSQKKKITHSSVIFF